VGSRRFRIHNVSVDIEPTSLGVVDVVFAILGMDKYSLNAASGINICASPIHRVRPARNKAEIPRDPVDLMRGLPGEIPRIDIG
jgi:hypothetical protein